MASGAHVALFGLPDLREALQRLPAELNADARREVETTIAATANELRAVYPIGPGRYDARGRFVPGGSLRAGVKTKITRGAVMTEGQVLSTAPHAHLWEFGTVNRKTRAGWKRGQMSKEKNRFRGLYAIAGRRRRALRARVLAIIARAGFTLKGAA